MRRFGQGNGGVIGAYVNTTSTAAGGVWTANDAANRVARRNANTDDVWPDLQDASFASVVGLYHFDTFWQTTTTALTKDSSGSALDLTLSTGVSNIAISNVQSKFGGYSMLGPAGGATYATHASNAVYNYGTGDWTVEGWAYVTNLNAGGTFFSQNHLAWTPNVYFFTDGKMYFYGNSADRIISAASVITLGAWKHWAAARSGSSTKMYYDGAQTGSTFTDSNTYVQSAVYVGIFPDLSTFPIKNVYIDEVRITKGVARYTGATYTVPTAPFPDY